MKFFQKTIVPLLAVILIASLFLGRKTNSRMICLASEEKIFLSEAIEKQEKKETVKAKSRRKENDIISEMVRTFCWHKQRALPRVDQLLKELASQDEKAAEKWEEVMAYWNYANYEMELNYGILPDGLKNTDKLCIIVLGYQLNPDGSMRKELLGRLETARACAEKYPDCYVLCTGGGTASQNRSATEADVMADWLEQHGIERKRIIVENKSLTTAQNAILSYDILRRSYPGIRTAAVVTSDYHVPWGIVLFQTKFILEGSKIRVVTNAAYDTATRRISSLTEYQRDGILRIAGIG